MRSCGTWAQTQPAWPRPGPRTDLHVLAQPKLHKAGLLLIPCITKRINLFLWCLFLLLDIGQMIIMLMATAMLNKVFFGRYTLIPTSMILGLGGAPLWSAKCTYLTIAGTLYAEKAGKSAKDIINQYFGIFFLVFQTSGVWGNLISSLILSQSSNQGKMYLKFWHFFL